MKHFPSRKEGIKTYQAINALGSGLISKRWRYRRNMHYVFFAIRMMATPDTLLL
jgi:hypothetical protein